MKAQINQGVLRAGRLLLVLVLGIFLVYLPVAAQEDKAAAPAPKVPGLKSESLAFSISLAGALLPWAGRLAGVRFAWIGVLIGPSLGYFYSGLWGRGLLGIGMRGLAGAAAVAGLVAVFIVPAGASLMLGGAAVLIASTL
ncbi:MAG: hypothetical protein OEW05_11335 [Candidatus Aminicenantes bacterium]|nr:hypothetical protein [Candidatus Aminicenantes bacterium]